MIDSKPKIRGEHILYTLILAMAVWLRLGRLDFAPLTDREAESALAAAELAGEGSPAWARETRLAGSSPAYQGLSGMLFALAGTGDSLARLVPALGGVALVMAPLLARKALGRSAALAASFLFVISPTLWSSARSAGGPSLAAFGLIVMLFIALDLRRESLPTSRVYWGAAAFGLLLASGPWSLSAALSLAFGAALYSAWLGRGRMDRPSVSRSSVRGGIGWAESRSGTLLATRPDVLPAEEMRKALFIAGLVMLGLASGLGFMASGIAGLFESAAQWLGGWTAPSTLPALAWLVMIPIYEPLILVFGIAGGIMAFRGVRPVRRFLVSWSIGAIALGALYPAREPEDMVWLVIPLGLLAADAVIELLQRLGQPKDWWVVAGFALAAIALTTFAFMQLTGYVHGLESLDVQLDFALQLGLAVIALGVTGVALIILGLGWGWTTTLQAAGAAALALLMAFTFSAGWQLNFTPFAVSGREIFRPLASTEGLRALSRSLGAISQLRTGRVDSLDIAFEDRPAAALAWELRDHPLYGWKSSAEGPPVLIARESPEPRSLPEGYLGQSFVITERWGWQGALPPNMMSWLFARDAPVDAERWVLFVRSDIVGAGVIVPAETEPES